MFEIGNVVRLKTGLGPDMTVDLVEDDIIECIWFTDNAELMAYGFRVELLELVRE